MSVTTWQRRFLASLLAIAALLTMVWLSRVHWRNPPADAAELRVSWRIPAPSDRRCRPPTDAELEGVLPHMRPAEICTDEAVPFRLDILLDGDTLRSGPVAGAGRRARAITVYERFAIPPGSHGIVVEFVPEAANANAPGARAMSLDASVTAAPGDVILVAPDDNERLYVSGGS